MHAGKQKDIHVKCNLLISLLRSKKGHCSTVSLQFPVQVESPMITADWPDKNALLYKFSF